MRLRTNIFGLAIIGLFLVGLAGCGFSEANRTPSALDAGSGSETISQTPSAPAPTLPSQSKGGVGQGIQVHGWWAISVLNSDGAQVQHREFENDLVPLAQGGGGDVFLARILGAQGSIQAWSLALFPMPGLKLASCTKCVTGDNGSLTVTTSGGQLVLEGSKVAPSDMVLTSVQSFPMYCLSPIAPSLTGGAVLDGTCGQTGLGNFTAAILAPSISMAAGQQVHVKVVFSFS